MKRILFTKAMTNNMPEGMTKHKRCNEKKKKENKTEKDLNSPMKITKDGYKYKLISIQKIIWKRKKEEKGSMQKIGTGKCLDKTNKNWRNAEMNTEKIDIKVWINHVSCFKLGFGEIIPDE